MQQGAFLILFLHFLYIYSLKNLILEAYLFYLVEMKKIFLVFLAAAFCISCSRNNSQEKFLLFYSPQSSNSLANFLQKARGGGITVDTISKLNLLKEDTLKFYKGAILHGLSGDSLDYRQRTELERYVQAGGGLVLVGSTLEAQNPWPWQKELQTALGGRYVDKLHASAEGEEKPVKGNEILKESFDGGRVVMLPSPASLAEGALQEALNFALKGDGPDYSHSRTKAVPEESRFTRKVLHNDMNEPMEMDILPDGSVIYIERRGAVKLYDAATNSVKQMANFEVCTEGNYEDGMLGLALDPNFKRNNRLYIYYSPNAACTDSVQRLSRFFFTKDTLVMSSEKVILEVPVQRETCCHSGGSIQFGPDGLLYLSTGDNTSSKESDGYTPIDERPGRGPYDAQKSSGNTQDLRGKILRIKVHKDGSYSIPEGNLFPTNGIQGRPEIYVMGARNPFRISIDQKTNWLYWGDVGPDAGVSSPQGTESFDEWNQARTAGNYGWPYFVANNIAYPDFDFTTNTPGEYFDPQNPVNDSPHNYGSRELPPAREAMIWYPYGESEEWPVLGTGSRSAMGGPIYYSDRYKGSEVAFPSYYDGKYFIYEWARSWIRVVSFDKQGNPEKIEPFMPDMPLSKPIDMEFGPDGAMYILEYGSNYFAKNDEARLVKIEYAEKNRKPVAVAIASTIAGASPLTVQFSAAESFDYDSDDKLNYQWIFEGDEVQEEGPEPSYTFKEVGVYQPKLIVTDQEGKEAVAELTITVGNAPPALEFAFGGNSSFYYEGRGLPYKISVKDPEDGSTEKGNIQAENVFVNLGFLPQGKDLAHLGKDAIISPHIEGRNLIGNSDCKSCHDMSKTSIGPSYQQVAERYHGQEGALEMLANKIIVGGSGNWGHSMMAAHPQHSMEETTKMVNYILSLGDKGADNVKATPLQGSFTFDRHQKDNEEGVYYLTVQYTDKGANKMPALSQREMIMLRHPRLQAEDYEKAKDAARLRPQGGAIAFVGNNSPGGYISFPNIDLKAIEALTFRVSSNSSGTIELHLNAPDGPKVAELKVPESNGEAGWQELKTQLKKTEGRHDLFFVFKGGDKPEKKLPALDWIYFHSDAELRQ